MRARLQWGHVVVDVEGMSALCPWRSPRRSFNGATSSSTWKVARRERNLWSHVAASMGPRRRRRGRIRSAFRVLASTSALQWGHVVVDVEGQTRASERKKDGRLQWGHVVVDVEGPSQAATSSRTLLLQWGHVVVEVEGNDWAFRKNKQRVASMGPRRRRRGRLERSATRRRARSSFNGATSSSTWKDPDRDVVANVDRLLQWGHVVVDVEGRLFSSLTRGASTCFNGATSSSTWKDQKIDLRLTGGLLLQWGHVVVDVEGHGWAYLSVGRRRGFNGATSSSTWKE